MSVTFAPPLANGNATTPWWVCPPDRELALRAKIRTGFSTVGGRVRNDNKTLTLKENMNHDSQSTSQKSFHSSFKMSPSLYRKLSSIQTQKKKSSANVCRYCDCGGMVSEGGISEQELDMIKKVVARAEELERMEEIRIGCLILQHKELLSKCSGNGTSNCLLCNQNLSLSKGSVIETCDYCQRAMCARCKVDTKSSSGQPVTCCKVCSEEQELWRKSGAWITMEAPKVAIPDKELLKLKEQLDLSIMPPLSRGYSLVEAPVGESLRSPSICSDISEEDNGLDISTALMKFNFPKPDADTCNASSEMETRSKSPLEVVSPSPTFLHSHTPFDEVEETSQTRLDDLLQSHASLRRNVVERKNASLRVGEGQNQMAMSSIKDSGALRRAREASPKQNQTMPANMKFTLSESPKKVCGPSPKHERRVLDHGELSHSSDSDVSSSDSELGDPLVIASTPCDSVGNIIGVVPDIVVQQTNTPTEDKVYGNVEEDSLSDRWADKSKEQETHFRRPRSYAIRTRPGSSPRKDRAKMFGDSSSEEEEKVPPRAGSLEKERTRANSGGLMKESGSSGGNSPPMNKQPTVDSSYHTPKESDQINKWQMFDSSFNTSEEPDQMNKQQMFDSSYHTPKVLPPHFSHQTISDPSPTTAKASSQNKHTATQLSLSLSQEGFSPLAEGKETVAELSQSLSQETFPHPSSPPRSTASSTEQIPHSSLKDIPPSASIIQNNSNKSSRDLSASSHISEETAAIAEKSSSTDLEKHDKSVTDPIEHKEESSLNFDPYYMVYESMTRAEATGGTHGAKSGEKSEPSHDLMFDPPVMKEVKPVEEVAPQPLVEVAPQPLVEVAPQPLVEVAPQPLVEVAPQPLVEEVSKSDAAVESSDQAPGSPPSANGKERYQWRRRGATRGAQRKEGSPSVEDESAMTKQQRARMLASRIHRDGRHISSSRERHQNDVEQDPNEEMVPYSGSGSLREEEEEEGGQIQRRRRDRARIVAGRVYRRDARLSSSRRRQYDEEDLDDL